LLDDLPFVEAMIDIVTDPALLPAVAGCALAVVCLPWWVVPFAAGGISVAAELIELWQEGHVGFVFGSELPERLLGTMVLFTVLHVASVATRRATRLDPVPPVLDARRDG
jgi:hypothetical protein